MSGKPIQYLFTLCFCLLCILPTVAQQKVTVTGIITDASTKQPVIYANIAFPELSIGTSSNEKGEFTIKNVPVGVCKLAVTYIGYQEYTLNMTLKADVNLKIKLKQQSLGLKEVVVTAENSSSGATASKIKSDAINYVQASSLKDVMQLIPGNISANPDLSKSGRLVIREVEADVNSALGTAIIVDDIPITNDGNLQNSTNTLNKFESSAGTGVDIRQISVENIESITVDVGIPSAEHGNLTSGAVHIKTKAGGSAYNIKLQTDPYTKQAYLGKGFLIKNDQGVINVDFGYTESYKHLVKQTDLYKRINGTAKYTKTYFREKSPLHVEMKLDLLSSIDGNKFDPDMLKEEERRAEDQILKGKISADWSLYKPYITSLTFDVGYSKTWQRGYEKSLESSSTGVNYNSIATSSGENEIFYAPSTYYSEVTYDGQPFNIYSKLKAKLLKKNGILTNNILLGTEWRTTGNNGKGRTYDVRRPPLEEGTRPRPFSDIPSLNQFSFFAEDKITMELGTTELNVMAGIRMDNIQPEGVFKTEGSLNFDPRINISYQLLNRKNNTLFRDLTLRFGYGQTTKAPTLTHLYPDKKYNDKTSFDYYPELLVTTTHVVEDTRNYNLQAAKSKKYEAGFDFQIGTLKSRFTGFYEKHTGGFILDQIRYPMYYRDYDIVEAGLKPYYIEGDGIYYNDETSGNSIKVGYEDDVTFKLYSQYKNASTRIKKGLEYSFAFGKVKAIRTSFVMNGAYLFTESYTTDAPYWDIENYTVFVDNSSKKESIAVKYPNQHGYGVVKQRLNSNLNIITHIPELKMLVTLTTQIIWFENDRRKRYDDYKLYALSDLREYLNQPELFKTENEDNFYYYLPVSYKEYDNIEREYQIENFENSLAQQAIKKSQKYLFGERVLPPLFLCNLKISKDIAQRFKLSFYANNFLNIQPWHLDKRSGKYIRRNESPYFGADIKMQF